MKVLGVAVAAGTFVSPFVAAVQKWLADSREQTARGRFIWASWAANLFSLIPAWKILSDPLDFHATAWHATAAYLGAGTAVLSLLFACLGRGPGLKAAISGAACLTVVWALVSYLQFTHD
jgi:hypothetical protein